MLLVHCCSRPLDDLQMDCRWSCIVLPCEYWNGPQEVPNATKSLPGWFGGGDPDANLHEMPSPIASTYIKSAGNTTELPTNALEAPKSAYMVFSGAKSKSWCSSYRRHRRSCRRGSRGRPTTTCRPCLLATCIILVFLRYSPSWSSPIAV